MKKTIYILILFSLPIFSQTKYLTKTGTVNFEASVPSFEEVAANNNSTTAILNIENGGFAALVLVKGFRFKNALMEEHFNENYAESDKYPKATFEGKIKDFSFIGLKTTTPLKMTGKLSFHGKTKKLDDIPLSLSNDNGIINIMGSFNVATSDFDIKIPKIVQNKVSETVKISFSFNLKAK